MPQSNPPASLERSVADPALRLGAGLGNTIIALAFAIALGASPSLTRPAALLVLGTGVVVWTLWFSLPPERAQPAAAADPAGVAMWLVIGAAFAVWELAAYLLGDDETNPTFSRLTDPVLAWPPARALAALGWVLWGRHLASLVAFTEDGEQ